MNFKQVTNIIIPEGSVVKITDPNGLVLWQKQSTFDGLCFTALEDGSYGMSHYGTNQTTTIPRLQYSRDGVNWTDWFFESISVNVGDKVYFKGNNPDGIGRSTSNYSKFTATGQFAASGNTMSILGVDEIKTYGFYCLFHNNIMITTAPKLPATKLTDNCYHDMFSGCTSLVQAPELPATTLAEHCYHGMFYNCILTQAPELPATALKNNCYYGMFDGCSSLVQAPELPATAAAIGCYENMFADCTSLEAAPDIWATVVAEGACRRMFQGCSSLKRTGRLDIANPIGYQALYGMFERTGLEKVELKISNMSGQYCLRYLFNGCSNLAEIRLPNFTGSWTDTNARNWVNGVASSGTFYKKSSVSIVTGANGIPSGWTVRAV